MANKTETVVLNKGAENADETVNQTWVDLGDGTYASPTQPSSDAGPSQAVTRTPFSSNDASSTPVDLTDAPGANLKAVAMDIIVSVVTACAVNIITESGSGFAIHMGANATVQLSPRGYIKGTTNDKKLQITTSVASVVSGVCNWFTEA